MSEDLLLEWTSERGSGSWDQLREAHQWLSTEERPKSGWQPGAGFAARTLSTLGHIEVDWRAGKWCAAPPVLTLLPSAGAHALVTGARTRALVGRLEEEIGDDSALYMFGQPQEHAPSALLIACEDETHIEALAYAAGIEYAFSVGQRLSRLLPDLDTYLELGATTPAATGFGVERMDLGTLLFQPVEQDRTPGLYRYDAYGRPLFRLLDSDGRIYDVDLAAGAYAALSRWGTNQLWYREESVNGTLRVPLRAPLPTLQARAAALCSGRAPRLVNGFHWYYNVPREIAERIARSLDQTLAVA